ncbi:MAG: lipase family protein [Bacteroidetes bacterium]|nr:lipase family protein [Bacteroidota bacterium]
MTQKHVILSLIFLFSTFPFSVTAGELKPGFDKEEYRELMLISARTTAEEEYYSKFPEPTRFKMIYQSPVIGLDNLWDLWKDDKNVAAISIRGTTTRAESWLVNLYAAMVPAKGKLEISANHTFDYELAANPRAAVHVGWLLSTAYLSQDILPKINELYNNGTREFLIMGHSQGGAIAFLLTAYLKNLQRNKKLADDIVFKTYCSAGPKPGNLYFAYDYEAAVQGGWAYNVVNAADWVPETPMSIQTVDDFNTTNPFKNARSAIKKQKFPQNLVLKHIYKKLDKPTRKAQNAYEKYLGEMTSKLIRSNIPEYISPDYYKSNHYVRTGNTIVLMPDAEYYAKYPDGSEQIFIHHFHEPYLFLLDRMK